MDSSILKFVTSERVCVLSVCMPNGTPHSASMHFSSQTEPFTIIIGTEKTTKKVQGLLNGQLTKASVVVGFDDTQMKTLQMDGTIKLITDGTALNTVHRVHYAKHPGAEKYKDLPDTCFLVFTPAWWRYSDFKKNVFLENK